MFFRKIKTLFSNPFFSIFIFVIAACNRLFVQVYYFTFGSDRSLQILSAKNFMNGHGITINQVMPADVAKEIYLPLTGWPPGYSIGVGITSFVTQQPVIIGSILFDLACVLLLLFYSRKILLHLNCSVAVVNFYTFVYGFFIYDFLRSSTSDLNAMAFFICSFSLCLNFIKNNKKGNAYAVAIATVGFLSAFIRYMFIPIAFVIPLYLIFFGKISGNKRILNGGLLATIATLIFIIALLIFQNQYTGAAAYINETTKGFYPGNLAQFYSVIFASFINTGFYYSVANSVSLLQYGEHAQILRLINFLIGCGLFVWLLKYFSIKKWRSVSLPDHFLFVGSITSVITIAMLAMLSLLYAPFILEDYTWTFVREARYFALPLVFLQLLFFVFIFQKWETLQSKFLKAVAIILFFFINLETLHGIYFTGKLLVNDKTVFHQNKQFIEQKIFIENLTLHLKENNPLHQIIFTSTDATYISLASINGAKGLYGLSNNTQLASSQPFILIIMLKEAELKKFTTLLASTEAKLFKTIGNLHFFEYRYK